MPKPKKSTPTYSTGILPSRLFKGGTASVLVAGLAVIAILVFAHSYATTPIVSKLACAPNAPLNLVPEVGKVCKIANGLYRVDLPGFSTFTHGLDTVGQTKPPTAKTTGASSWSYSKVAPTCVSQSDYHNHLIYANPAGQTNRYSSMASQINDTMQYANGDIHNEGLAFGLNVNFKFWCGIDNVNLSTSSTNYSDIVSDLRSKGFTSTLAKYWVFVDTNCVGGVSGIMPDDSLLPKNSNNVGPTYALDLGCIDGGGVMAHESGHSLGAVQQSAPHSTTGWHCNDGYSFMCYGPDGSSNSNWYQACNNISYDCNNDDYFNPYPPAGSYLASHWNIASGFDNFISGLPTPPKDTTPPTAPTGLTGAAASSSQIRLNWNGSTDDRSGVAGYKVYRDNTEVGSTTEPTYTLTDGGLAASSYHTYGVKAIDGAGNLSAWSNPVTVQTYRLCLFVCVH
ncbi:MAG TPA: fibronectin type III domain-containing protein [Candidatus Nanoarchaeia archaeon]|nr:fibronectin type III domain-containing protein [Candidatus Nanoarchaeia archaeon]